MESLNESNHTGKLAIAVGSAIKDIRKSQKMSQEELAIKSGVDRSYISGIEHGSRNITCYSLELLVTALDMELKTFLALASAYL